MSLPPGFLDELRNRLSLAQVAGRKVIWDSKKTNQAKGDFWAPCPFHQEKTPSFHVDDRKGYYYCFGCHEKGDMIGFVMGTENVGFMEAVEILANEAGVPMPARDPRAKEKQDRNKELGDVMEMAVQFFKLHYASQAGTAARDYVRDRKLPVEIQERFEIGFAPASRDALYQHLRGKNVDEQKIVGAGLAGKPDDGRSPFDRFRNRIIFPIRDARGRCIAFGGRAMDPKDNAKYLNSPETPLFDKSRTLYNLGPAREAAGKTDQLIVAEGYMDVIALSQFGFGQSVAPLGTAITEHQLQMLWRIHPEPIIALDGDTAGLRAAMRLIDLALPVLEAGKSLRFCLMPEGQDPDDYLKAHGAGAMSDLLGAAQPMVNLLWRRETDGKTLDSPERRAALDKALREAIFKIKDKSIRQHYGFAIAKLRKKLFDPLPDPEQYRRYKNKFSKPNDGPKQYTKSTFAHKTEDEYQTVFREYVILLSLILQPKLIIPRYGKLEKILLKSTEAQSVLDALLNFDLENLTSFEDVNSALEKGLGFSPVKFLRKVKGIKIHPYLQDHTTVQKIERTLEEELAKLAALSGAQSEIADAIEDMGGLVDEGLTWRLSQAAEAKTRAMRAIEDDEDNADNADEGLSDQLQQMIDNQVWVKKNR